MDCEESWAPKNWCFWSVVLEKTLQSPLDCKEIQPIHSKGDQSWVFIRRTDAKAETPILWPPHAKSWLIGKDSDAGRDLVVRGEGEDGRWDGWMALPTQWTWVWVNSGSWWWTGRPSVLPFMGSQRVDTTEWLKWTELNWTESIFKELKKKSFFLKSPGHFLLLHLQIKLSVTKAEHLGESKIKISGTPPPYIVTKWPVFFIQALFMLYTWTQSGSNSSRPHGL